MSLWWWSRENIHTSQPYCLLVRHLAKAFQWHQPQLCVGYSSMSMSSTGQHSETDLSEFWSTAYLMSGILWADTVEHTHFIHFQKSASKCSLDSFAYGFFQMLNHLSVFCLIFLKEMLNDQTNAQVILRCIVFATVWTAELVPSCFLFNNCRVWRTCWCRYSYHSALCLWAC